MEILLSIIIPVYNVEEYIDECLTSVLCQITKSCEIVLVDDGSKDSSGAKCDAYAGKQVRVIHKANRGLSSARNAGLSESRGKYIAFLDSDDRLAMGSISRILSWIESHEADVCFLDAIKFFPDGKVVPLGDSITCQGVEGKTNEEVMAYISTRPKFPGSSCTKIYSRRYLEDNCISFPKDRRTSEDLWFVTDCFINADSFGCIEGPYYEYRQSRKGSITSSVTMNGVYSLVRYVDHYANTFCVNKKALDNKMQCMMSLIAYEYVQLLMDYAVLGRSEQKRITDEIVKLKWTLQYGRTTRLRTIWLFVSLFGVKFTSILLKVYAFLK